MNNKKATKRALLTSITALAMCVVMLAGTTFAWFTDTATASVNKIQAGTLDVKLEMLTKGSTETTATWKDAKGQTLEFKKAADAPTNEAVLWEPGCTYELPAVRVVNNGNLALKYIISVTGVDGDSELLDAIEFMVKVGNDAAVPLANLSGILLPEGKTGTADEKVQYSDSIVISGHMKETAGNGYQDERIEGVGITVYATQYTYEYDSYNKTYDEIDLWDGTVATDEELKAATDNTKKTVTISSAKLLAKLAQEVNDGTSTHITDDNSRKLAYDGYTITLTKDINLAGISWTPIGNSTYPFAGTFDGDNHTISNLTIDAADGVKDVGLIGYARHATIENLTVSDAKVSDVGRIGVILGKGEQKNTIQNCTVKDSVITAKTWLDPNENNGKGGYNDGDKAGAVAGYLCEGGNVVTGCTVKSCTITGYRDIGGLIGGIGGVDHGTYGETMKDSVAGNTVADTTINWDKTYDYQSGKTGYGTNAGYDVNKIVGEIADSEWNGVENNTETSVTIRTIGS